MRCFSLIFSVFMVYLSAVSIAMADVSAVDDRQLIAEKIYRYAHYYDDSDIEALMTLFTKDAVSELVRGEKIQRGSVSELMKFTADRMKKKVASGVVRRHLMANTVITSLTDVDAKALVTVLIMEVINNKLTPYITAEYHFSLKKKGNAWLINYLLIDSDVAFK